MNDSRTKSSVRNIAVGVITMGVSFLATFIYRWLFLKVLSVEYLGVTGLFGSIITILSLTELGFNGAVMFVLYKPLAENNKEKIASILKYYRKIYYIVAAIVLTAGLCFIPLLKFFIPDAPQVSPNIYVIYIFVLAGAFLSYFNSYKYTLLLADQKEYITKVVFFICKLSAQILQLVLLFLTKSFYSVIVLDVLIVVVQNLILTIIVNKKYPYIRQKCPNLSKDERRSINKYSTAMMAHKISGIVLSSTDNIIISSFLGTFALGLCTNYIVVTSALNSVVNAVFTGLAASLGNYVFTKNKTNQYGLYNATTIMGTWFAMFVSFGFFFVSQDFITIWLGEEYLLDNLTVAMLALALFFENYSRPIDVFSTAKGLFKKTAPFTILYAAINLGVSIGLVIWIGVPGVFLGTVISRAFMIPVSVYINNHYGFNLTTKSFYLKMAYQLLAVMIAFATTYLLCRIKINNIYGSLIYKLFIVCLAPNAIYLLFFLKKNEFEPIRTKASQIIEKIRQRKYNNKKENGKLTEGKIICFISADFSSDESIFSDTRNEQYTQLKEILTEAGYILKTPMETAVKDADIVIFNDTMSYGKYEFVYDSIKAGNAQNSIYFALEPPVTADINEKEKLIDWSRIFKKTVTVQSDLNNVGNIVYYTDTIDKSHYDEKELEPFECKKLLTSISGNKHSKHPQELYSAREEAYKFFAERFGDDFDFYGCGFSRDEFKAYRGKAADKQSTLKNYKFALAYENMEGLNGYVTEKIFDVFKAGAVPIYRGAGNITEYIDKDCIIFADDFEDLNALADYLENMSDAEYSRRQDAIKAFLNGSDFYKYTARYYADFVFRLITEESRSPLSKRQCKNVLDKYFGRARFRTKVKSFLIKIKILK